MRIDTTGNQAYRKDLFKRTERQLNASTKTEGIERACTHTTTDIRQKEEALDYLSERLSPAELQEIAEILSTDTVPLSVEIETSVGPEDTDA